MAAGIFSVGTTPTTGPLSVKQFYAMPPATPGNVGVCLSGGGSRALTAGMGQLRALNKITANGQSLLAQAKALSTVSGGSWLGVPFIYLPPGSSSDAAYLGPWIEDQSTLTPAILAQLPAGNAGVPISSPLFAPKLLAVQALLLHAVLRVPPDMLWQTIIGLNILADHGLYAPTTHLTPTDTFSFNAAVVASQITNLNPALAGEPIDLYADARDPTRTHRPFLVCNSAMFLKEPNTALELLAPVQITPFITGIFGTPTGVDGNGRKPGGGGVNTFGFNSAYVNASSSTATVAQTRQWSLTDAVGTSSAFFAEVLQNLFRGWRQNPADLAALVARSADTIQHWIRTKLPIEARGAAAELLPAAWPTVAAGRAVRPAGNHSKLPILARARSAAQHAADAQPVRGRGEPGEHRHRRAARLFGHRQHHRLYQPDDGDAARRVRRCRRAWRVHSWNHAHCRLPAFRRCSAISHMGQAAWARTRVTFSTARVRPISIPCMPTTRSSSPRRSRPCCRVFGRRAAAGVTHTLPSFRSDLSCDRTRGSA